jgi:hypothetical protein
MHSYILDMCEWKITDLVKLCNLEVNGPKEEGSDVRDEMGRGTQRVLEAIPRA